MFQAYPMNGIRVGIRLARFWRAWTITAGLVLALALWLPTFAHNATPDTSVPPPVQLRLPLVAGGTGSTALCPRSSTNSYTTLPINGPLRDPDQPPLLDPDLNLFIRGYTPANGLLSLIEINGPTDADAPQLAYLFRPVRVPTFVALHQVYAWDWGCRIGGCKGAPIALPEATLLEMATTPTEAIFPPHRNATIGGEYIALVHYAEETRMTFTYTREDTPAFGYVVHLESFCVDPNLLALYEEMNLAGRANLPALRRTDSIGSAKGEKILVAVRDTGSFMDPRSAKDWWQDRVRALLAAQADHAQ